MYSDPFQGACKLTLPETDEDLIDSRDFHVFSHDKSEEFSLTSQLKHIPYLTFNNNEYPPTLILESSIFRSAVEVDIDDRVGRRRGTEITKYLIPSKLLIFILYAEIIHLIYLLDPFLLVIKE